MEYTERKKVESLILLIDFRKAFDSLSHRYIDECLKLFNFGPSIRKWVSLFFCNREAYILLGGELSKSILLEQGVPQGDVVSPYIFILAVELLLIKINNTKHIEGITYATKESRSETFADDTSIFIKRNPEYLRKCIEFLEHFARISGLQCNLDKISVIPIGGNFDIEDKLCPELALSWENNFTFLGFQIDNRLEKLDVNYKKGYQKIHEISRRWAKYRLSLKGRITITKFFCYLNLYI